jgi:hypothetical protein
MLFAFLYSCLRLILDLEPIGSCQVLDPPSVGSKSRPERQTPQTMARDLDMQWPMAFMAVLP